MKRRVKEKGKEIIPLHSSQTQSHESCGQIWVLKIKNVRASTQLHIAKRGERYHIRDEKDKIKEESDP